MRNATVILLTVFALANIASAESFTVPLEDLSTGETCALVEEHEFHGDGFVATIICSNNKETSVFTSVKLPRYFRIESGGKVSEIDESSVVSVD